MNRGFVIKYDTYNNKLILFKDSKRKGKQIKDGKYGVQFCYNIKEEIIGLCIPEPEILFGIDRKDLENFFKEELK